MPQTTVSALAEDVDTLFAQMVVKPDPPPPPAALAAEAEEEQPVSWRPLPPDVSLDPQLAENASRWLADYSAFSARWSPRAHHDFHIASGLWVLSTVAARRVALHLGGLRHPNLYIALAAWTGLWAKSTTVKIGLDVLRAAKLDFLLAPDEATPQALVQSMTQRLPDNWGQLPSVAQQQIQQRLSFFGQKGWFYEELVSSQ